MRFVRALSPERIDFVLLNRDVSSERFVEGDDLDLGVNLTLHTMPSRSRRSREGSRALRRSCGAVSAILTLRRNLRRCRRRRAEGRC
jgi:hypothetical protein